MKCVMKEKIKKSEFVRFFWFLFVYICYLYILFVYKINKTDYFRRIHLKKLLEYAKMHSKYYNNLLKNTDITYDNCIDTLHNLPILTKKIIREQGTKIFSDNIGNCRWLNTGGSTGEPLSFPYKRSLLPYEACHQLFLYKLMGWKYNEIIVSFSGYTPTPEQLRLNKIYRENNNFPYGRYDFSSFYINEEYVSLYVNELNKIKPKIIRSYPSSLSELCKLIRSHNLKLTFELKGIYVTSEMLTDDDEKIIREVFNCPIWGQYGHTEISIFAIKKDKQKEYVVSPFYGYTEILDEHNKQVKNGERGEIIVTGFSSLGLPFIRYSTGDLAIYNTENNKNEIVIDGLQGRTVDYVIDNNNNRIFLTGFIFGNHLMAFNNIFAWQLVQNKVGEVDMRIIKGDNYSISDEQSLIKLFMNNNINVKMNYSDEIVKSKRGKRIFMIQNCK